jgi:uncharacterized protein (UPF0332 family)
MPISPKDLFDLVRELLQREGEARHRAGASRAYYAAFHKCGLLPLSPVPVKRGGGTHSRLIQALRNYKSDSASLQAEVRSLADLLTKARDLRTDADYRLNDTFRLAKAQLLLGLAAEIIRRGDAAVAQAQ